MSEAIATDPKAPPAEGLGTTPDVPKVETPEAAKVEAPKNGAGTAPVVGQTQAAENAKAAEKLAADKAAAEKLAADTQAAKDTENAAKHAADKAWGEWKPKAPEGITLDEKQVKGFAELARAEGLKPEQAQKFIDFQGAALKAQQAAAGQFMEANAQRELSQLKATRGESFKVDMVTANKAIDHFGSPELKQYLRTTGQYANPHLFKLFHAIGVAMADDRIADGAGLGGGKAAKKGLESLYNNPTSRRQQ